MSATVEATLPGLTEKQERIATFLTDHVDTKTYFKSRLIGEELGMSAKEVGANIRAVRDATPLTIETVSYTHLTLPTKRIV